MRRTTTAAWFSFEIIALTSVWAARLDAAAAQPGSSLEHRFGYLAGPVFALMGALILTYRPDNRVGWLLMLPGASAFVLVDAYLGPLIDGSAPLPPALTPGLWLALWYSNWNWTLLIFPLLWLMLLFPTGRPISRRWGWLVWVGVVLMLFLLLLATFGTPMSPGSGRGVFQCGGRGRDEGRKARRLGWGGQMSLDRAQAARCARIGSIQHEEVDRCDLLLRNWKRN